MISIKKHRTIFSLKSAWLSIERSSKDFAIFQTYEFQKALFYRLPIYAVQEKAIYAYYEVKKDNKTVIIAPVSHNLNSKRYSIIGNMGGVAIYDFIYDKSIGFELFSKCIDELFRKIKADSWDFNWVSGDGMLYKYLIEKEGVTAKEISNVAIPLPDTYDAYYNALSKHTRQNIRTAYNRLNSDGKQFEFELIAGKKLSRKKLNSLIEVYNNRHVQRYGIHISKLKDLYLKYFDYITRFYNNSNENYYGILYIDKKIAAFFSGAKYNKSIVVPRLSILDEFSRYSPGIVLINETMQKIIGDEKIDRFDLSKGNEKYKYTMGGIEYYTYRINVGRIS